MGLGPELWRGEACRGAQLGLDLEAATRSTGLAGALARSEHEADDGAVASRGLDSGDGALKAGAAWIQAGDSRRNGGSWPATRLTVTAAPCWFAGDRRRGRGQGRKVLREAGLVQAAGEVGDEPCGVKQRRQTGQQQRKENEEEEEREARARLPAAPGG